MHGHGLVGFVGLGIHLILTGALFYFLFHITKSLRIIAGYFENKK